jgi:ribosomal protein S27E
VSSEPVRFEPVEDAQPDAQPQPAGPELEEPDVETLAEADEAREAERDPFPLAGPILDGARSRVLRGRCSGCEARLRVELDGDASGPARVRCPICGRTGEIDA